jgi:serine-type D-Ala-D-Ala carboxypeptidase (penicillin-binding protein 5/6)
MIGMLTRDKKLIQRAGLALAGILAIGLIPSWGGQIKQLDHLHVLGRQQERVLDINSAPELAAFVEKPVLTARSVLAYDLNSGSMLYTQNFDEKLPVASLTKLVTALVVVDSGKLNDEVEILESDTRVIGANAGLVAGERLKISDLLKSTLISSHNDSTLAMSRYVGGTVDNFVRMMNIKARSLGMASTNFENPIGFDHHDHYSSAHDLQLVLEKFLENETLNEIVRTPEAEIKAMNMPYTHKLTTTNKLLLEDSSVIGVKTGYTTEAKGNLVVRSVRDRADVVTIVLGSDNREGDTRKILDWIHAVYRW